MPGRMNVVGNAEGELSVFRGKYVAAIRIGSYIHRKGGRDCESYICKRDVGRLSPSTLASGEKGFFTQSRNG